MRNAKTDPVSRWGTRGGKVLGIVLGLALAFAPAFGEWAWAWLKAHPKVSGPQPGRGG